MLQFSSLAVVHQNAYGFLRDNLYSEPLSCLDALASARFATSGFVRITLRRWHILVGEWRTQAPPIRIGSRGRSRKGDAETLTTDHSWRDSSLSQGRGICHSRGLWETGTSRSDGRWTSRCTLPGSSCGTRCNIGGRSDRSCFFGAHRMKLKLTSFTGRTQRRRKVLHTSIEFIVELGTLHLSPATTYERRVVLHSGRLPSPFGRLGLGDLLPGPLSSRSRGWRLLLARRLRSGLFGSALGRCGRSLGLRPSLSGKGLAQLDIGTSRTVPVVIILGHRRKRRVEAVCVILGIATVAKKSFLGVTLGEADTTGAEDTNRNAVIVVAHDTVRTLLLVRRQMALALLRCLGLGLLPFLLLLFRPLGCTLGLLFLLLATSLGVPLAPATRLALLVLSQNIRQQLPLALLAAGRSRGTAAGPGLGLLLAGPVHIAAHIAGIVQCWGLALLPPGARAGYVHLLGRHGPEQELELGTLELLLIFLSLGLLIVPGGLLGGSGAELCGSSRTRGRILVRIYPQFGLGARGCSGRRLRLFHLLRVGGGRLLLVVIAIVIPTRNQTSNLLGSQIAQIVLLGAALRLHLLGFAPATFSFPLVLVIVIVIGTPFSSCLCFSSYRAVFGFLGRDAKRPIEQYSLLQGHESARIGIADIVRRLGRGPGATPTTSRLGRRTIAFADTTVTTIITSSSSCCCSPSLRRRVGRPGPTGRPRRNGLGPIQLGLVVHHLLHLADSLAGPLPLARIALVEGDAGIVAVGAGPVVGGFLDEDGAVAALVEDQGARVAAQEGGVVVPDAGAHLAQVVVGREELLGGERGCAHLVVVIACAVVGAFGGGGGGSGSLFLSAALVVVVIIVLFFLVAALLIALPFFFLAAALLLVLFVITVIVVVAVILLLLVTAHEQLVLLQILLVVGVESLHLAGPDGGMAVELQGVGGRPRALGLLLALLAPLEGPLRPADGAPDQTGILLGQGGVLGGGRVGAGKVLGEGVQEMAGVEVELRLARRLLRRRSLPGQAVGGLAHGGRCCSYRRIWMMISVACYCRGSMQ
mmetsp:Transcript_8307/g.23164  ORF Transcript_8307/g.23164 Transcript_8307/m.23164 type:complete len:1036 (-) Transcript_8307:14-3121(-)